MSTRPRLEASVIVPIDFGDQPECPYVFLVEGLIGPRQAFSIDTYVVDSTGYVVGRRGGQDVIAVPIAAPWCVVRRDALLLSTITESAKKRKVDDAAQVAFEQELYPKGATSEVAPALGYKAGPGVYA